MREIDNYKKAFAAIAKKFTEKYFANDEWEILPHYIIWEDLPMWWNTIAISEDWFVSIYDAITCLELNIPEEMFFEWYDRKHAYLVSFILRINNELIR